MFNVSMPLSLGLGFLFFCFFAKSCDPKSTPLQKQKQKQTNKKNTGKKQSQLPCRPESSNLNKAARIPLSGGEGESERPPTARESGDEAPGLLFLPPPDFDRGFPVSEPQKTSFLRHRAQGRRMGRVNLISPALWSSYDYLPS